MATESTPDDRLKTELQYIAERQNASDTQLRAVLLKAYLDGVSHTALREMSRIAWPQRDK